MLVQEKSKNIRRASQIKRHEFIVTRVGALCILSVLHDCVQNAELVTQEERTTKSKKYKVSDTRIRHKEHEHGNKHNGFNVD